MKRVIINAIEQDGRTTRTLPMVLEVLTDSKDFNAVQACKDATNAYLATEDGVETYVDNCSQFNWADFWVAVPDEFCERFGFRKVTEESQTIDVNWDEQLAVEPVYLEVRKIRWSNPEDCQETLPLACCVPVGALDIPDGEDINTISEEALKKAIADYLAGKYGNGRHVEDFE